MTSTGKSVLVRVGALPRRTTPRHVLDLQRLLSSSAKACYNLQYAQPRPQFRTLASYYTSTMVGSGDYLSRLLRSTAYCTARSSLGSSIGGLLACFPAPDLYMYEYLRSLPFRRSALQMSSRRARAQTAKIHDMPTVSIAKKMLCHHVTVVPC